MDPKILERIEQKYGQHQGPTETETRDAHRRNKELGLEQSRNGSSMQSGVNHWIGTPRNAKRQQFFGGHRIR